MPEFPDEPIDRVKARLLEGMVDFMEPDEDEPDEGDDYDCGYTQSDIDRCEELINDYLERLGAIAEGDEIAIKGEVKRFVQALNELNGDCGGSLIETEQREDLCQIILVAARDRGLDTDDDVTMEWRQW